MNTRLKILLTILSFVFLYAVYYWAVPFAININGKVPLIKSYIKNDLGADVEIKNPSLKMGLTPSIWIDASYFGFVDKKSSPFAVVNPKLKIRLIPLLFGKIELAYFSCDKINADLKIDKDSRFYIGNYLIMKSSNPKVSIDGVIMNIDNYRISLKDELQHKNIFANGDYFNLEKYNSKKYLKFSTNSKLKINKKYSFINIDVNLKLPLKKTLSTDDIVFDGTITNLDLADFSFYIKQLSKNRIQQIGGTINVKAETRPINFNNDKRVKIQMAVDKPLISSNEISLYSKNKLNIYSLCDFSKNTLAIKKLQFLSKNINATVTGKIKKIKAKKPIFDLAVDIHKSRIEDFVSVIPTFKIKDAPINFIALKKYGYYGNIDGKIFIKGKAGRPDITGNFLSTEGYVVKPLDIPKATVKLKFLGQKLYMDILVPASKTEKVKVKGTVDLYGDKVAAIDVSTTPNINLETTVAILNPVHEIFYFDIGPIPAMKLQGAGNINLKIRGTKSNPHLFGILNFKNTTACFNGIDILLKNGDGTLYFNDTTTHFIAKKGLVDNRPIKVDGKCSLKGDLDFNIISNAQDLKFLIKVLRNSPKLKPIEKAIPPINDTSGKVNLSLKLKGRATSIDDFSLGKTVGVSGTIKLLGNTIVVNNLQTPIKGLFGEIKFNNTDADFNLYSLVNKSKIYIKGKVKNNVLNLKAKLDGLSFPYANIPVKVFGGNLEIHNNKLILYKVNAVMDTMPVLVDGFVTDIFHNPKFNLYINSKPNQRFIEKYINKTTTYPLKIKGDIIYTSRIQGTKDLFNAKTEINLQEDSNIYYMGSTLGDANNPIRIFLDTNIAKNSIDVKKFQYDKLISSQNGKEFVSPQLTAKGQINFDKKNINFHNFKVITQNPTDAKIFNILFKRPMIKQGLFTSNVILNQSLTSPKMIGKVNFTGIDIPILDTTIKDISLDFGNDKIDIKSKGEIFSNAIVLFATMKNNFKPPFVFDDVDIYFGNLDINEIVKNLDKLQLETNMQDLIEPNENINIANLIIKKAKLKADSVFVKNLFAKDLTADFSLDDKLLFALNNFKFDIAQGTIKGDFKYNFLNSKSALDIHVDNVNANEITDALFDLPNQIFGSLAGDVDLVCNGKTHKTCMDTLSGKGGFTVSDGRMPKLGSLEYLLKAANLVKSGVTGLTINGIIDLVTPLKTGNFENINGSFSINSGLADSIQIFSKGKDLSLFLTGTYNFSTLIADMEVFGRLSKKMTNVLGPVGNTSLNTLFNTIPGLNLDETNKAEFIQNLNKIPGFELNDKTYRIFSVKIYGDINGSNYVQSFKWIE